MKKLLFAFLSFIVLFGTSCAKDHGFFKIKDQKSFDLPKKNRHHLETLNIDFSGSLGNDTLIITDEVTNNVVSIYASNGMQQTVQLNLNHSFTIDWNFYSDGSSCAVYLVGNSGSTIASAYLNPVAEKTAHITGISLSEGSLSFYMNCR